MHYGDENLYDMLGVPVTASTAEILIAIQKKLDALDEFYKYADTDPYTKTKKEAAVFALFYAKVTLINTEKRREYDNRLLKQDKNIVMPNNNIAKTSAKNEYQNVYEKANQSSQELRYISKYGQELTNKQYSINPAIGREKEIESLELALITPDKSAIIVGEAGVGKTAVGEGLAYLISQGKVPRILQGFKIFKLNASSIVAGTCFRGEFEERLTNIMEELKRHKDVILFIDEIHTIMGAGTSLDKPMDFANIMKPYLDRGDIKIIGATTEKEYNKHILSDEALKRRFEKIVVLEPSKSLCESILSGTIPKLEHECKIKYDIDPLVSFQLMNYIVDITNKQYRTKDDNQNNPDLALTILKKAFAYAVLKDKTSVRVEDFVISIMNCERLLPEFRNKFAMEMFDNLYASPSQTQNDLSASTKKNLPK